MFLKLEERYKYCEPQDKDLRTFLIEFDNIEYFYINLLSEKTSFKMDEEAVKISKELGSKFSEIKYYLCKDRPNIDHWLEKDEFLINDYLATKILEHGFLTKVIIVILRNNGKETKLLLDKRRYNIQIYNSNNVLVEDF